MNTAQYDKIQDFVKNNYQELLKADTLIVKTLDNGFRVGEWFVKNLQNGWQVEDRAGRQRSTMKQRRLAVLVAALLHRKNYAKAHAVCMLDTTYDILSNDIKQYSARITMNPGNKVYSDRLGRAEKELEMLKSQIYELEKTVHLQ